MLSRSVLQALQGRLPCGAQAQLLPLALCQLGRRDTALAWLVWPVLPRLATCLRLQQVQQALARRVRVQLVLSEGEAQRHLRPAPLLAQAPLQLGCLLVRPLQPLLQVHAEGRDRDRDRDSFLSLRLGLQVSPDLDLLCLPVPQLQLLLQAQPRRVRQLPHADPVRLLASRPLQDQQRLRLGLKALSLIRL